MTEPPMGFKTKELEFLQDLEREWRVEFDYGAIAWHLNEFSESENKPGHLREIFDYPNHKRAAAHIYFIRHSEELGDELGFDFSGAVVRDFLLDLHLIDEGYEDIQELETEWLYEPTIEKILELDPSTLEALREPLMDFFEGEDSLPFRQYRLDFYDLFDRWESGDTSASNIETGLEAYQLATNIFETGFPLLLLFKRTLDGADPELEELLRLRQSAVIEELTDTTGEPNSVYFDLIVKQYDKRLRNALSHGDIANDTVNSKLRIVTQNRTYSYTKFDKIATRNFSNAIFLSSIYYSLILNQTIWPEEDFNFLLPF